MGTLIGILRAPVRHAPVEVLEVAEIRAQDGITGDARGVKPHHQVTLLFREGWEAACRDLGKDLSWTVRRANLYVDGPSSRRAGDRIAVGEAVLEVVEETRPCVVMERAEKGLRAALAPDWRGGVTCRVLRVGRIRLGDPVEILS